MSAHVAVPSGERGTAPGSGPPAMSADVSNSGGTGILSCVPGPLVTTVPVPDRPWERRDPSSLGPSQPAVGERGAPPFPADSRMRRVFPRPVLRGFRAAGRPSGRPGRSAGNSEARLLSLRYAADGEAATGPLSAATGRTSSCRVAHAWKQERGRPAAGTCGRLVHSHQAHVVRQPRSRSVTGKPTSDFQPPALPP